MATKLYIPNLLEFIYGYIIGKGKTKVFDLLGREDFKKVRIFLRIFQMNFLPTIQKQRFLKA